MEDKKAAGIQPTALFGGTMSIAEFRATVNLPSLQRLLHP